LSLRTFLAETFGPVQRTESDIELASTLAWESQISDFWGGLSGGSFSPTLIERVWVANRCIHLNAQQIARMPLRFHGSSEPAWVANPDPIWYPNGVGDAVYAAIDSMYRWGDAFLYVTSYYASGLPSAWTVLDASQMSVEVKNGRRAYRKGQTPLDPDRVVQVSRDPRGIRGTSAISSYSAQAYGLLAASDLGQVMMTEGVPSAVLKSQRKLTKEQAEALQAQWVTRTASRRGAPAVLPPDIDFETLSFSPADLMLLDVQKFDAQVIASAMGVPALFLNLPIEGGLSYQSPAMVAEHWWRTELRPMASALATALSAQMLARGSHVEFDAYETLAPSFAELVDAWAKMLEDGVVTIEEFRAAVLKLPSQQMQEEALAALTTPPSAGASPAQQPPSVVALRPTGVST
jgi:HK97 family phage portal protein